MKKVWFFVEGDTEEIFISNLIRKKLYKTLIFLIAAAWGSGAYIFALNPLKGADQYLVQFYSRDSGLPQNSVLQICQTGDGFLWLGTNEGLTRFDGFRFSTFDKSNTPEMKNSKINALSRDPDDSLWIGTSNGLLRFRQGHFQRFTERDGLSSVFIISIYRDSPGTLWVGTTDGLNRLDNDARGPKMFISYSTADGLAQGYVSDLADDNDGNLWIATGTRGLDCFNKGTFSHFSSRDGLPHDEVKSLYKSRDGQVWVGTVNGLAVLKKGTPNTFTTLFPEILAGKEIRAIYRDAAQSLWVGTNSDGIFCFKKDSFSHFPLMHGDSASPVQDILEDREGNLWIGCTGGLFQFIDGKLIIYSREHGLPAGGVRSVLEDRDGTIWAGSAEKGVFRFENGHFAPVTLNKESNSTGIWAIAQGNDGSLWFGTSGQGLFRWKNEKVTAFSTREGLSNDTVRAVYADHRDRVWVGTNGGGVNVIVNGKITAHYSSLDILSDDSIYAITGDKDGSLWFGTYRGGLNRWKDNVITVWGFREELFANPMWTLLPDNDGSLWIGTNDLGLKRFIDGKFTTFSVFDGLFSDLAFQVLEDGKGYLWMNGMKGISCISKKELQDFTDGKIYRLHSRVLGYSQEILRSAGGGPGHPSAWKTNDGKLWFSTISGVAVVDPENIPVNQVPPAVALEKLIIDGRPVDLASLPENQEMVIPPGKKRLEFQYTGISFIDAPKVRFKIKLDGYDKDWFDAGTDRKYTYMNLDPGAYNFRVIACNSDGIWNSKGVLLRFRLKPYFTRSWWFKGLVVFIIFAGIYLCLRRPRTPFKKGVPGPP